MRIGVLTGLEAEARLLRTLFPQADMDSIVVRTGADPARARREAERLAGAGVSALLSFGLSGGLDPRLKAGDLILADRVVLPDGRTLATDAAWLARAQERVEDEAGGSRPGLHVGAVAGADRLLATLADKRRLSQASGALAVDMESGAAAAAAEAAGLPFLVVRAVSDCAGTTLPAVARVPLLPCGGLDVTGVTRALCTRPGEWRAVARLALDTRAALGALRGVVRAGALLPG